MTRTHKLLKYTTVLCDHIEHNLKREFFIINSLYITCVTQMRMCSFLRLVPLRFLSNIILGRFSSPLSDTFTLLCDSVHCKSTTQLNLIWIKLNWVLQSLDRSIVIKILQISLQTKLCFLVSLHDGQKLWVVTKKRAQVQAVEMRFFCMGACYTMLWSLTICEVLGVDSLLL